MSEPKPVTPNPRTIGILVGRDQVGDALMKLPFLWALRHAFPKARITWITSNGPTAYGNLLREETKHLIDEIIEQPEWLGGRHSAFSIQEVSSSPNAESQMPNAPRFDLLIDTRNRWRETLDAKKIPHGLFLTPALRYLFSEKRPPLLKPKPDHLVDKLLQLVELASDQKPDAKGALPVPDDLMQKAQQILPPGPTYVGLAPGAGYEIKIWPRYKFEKLAALQASKGRVPVFILGPQEQAVYDTLAVTVPAAKFPLQDYKVWGVGKLTIAHTLAVAKCLNVAVANDSGVGHMLAAVDCPLISLFGPTSPAKLAPRVSQSRIIRSQAFGSNRIKAIRWEAVDEAVDDMLSARIDQ